jgi:uncharacterized protein (TIGR02001 family)
VVSDYDWRGLSQTNDKRDGGFFGGPAVQLGLNYGFESGFYVGAWGSNIEKDLSGGADVEVDVFAGYAGGDAAEGIGYDIGINTYNYPSASDSNFWEVYAGISHGMFSGKLWYSPEFGTTSDPGIYAEGNVTYPLPANFSLMGHVGYSFGSAFKPNEYLDYSAGVGYTFDKFSLAAKYVSTDLKGYDDDKFVLSVSTTLPWGK